MKKFNDDAEHLFANFLFARRACNLLLRKPTRVDLQLRSALQAHTRVWRHKRVSPSDREFGELLQNQLKRG